MLADKIRLQHCIVGRKTEFRGSRPGSGQSGPGSLACTSAARTGASFTGRTRFSRSPRGCGTYLRNGRTVTSGANHIKKRSLPANPWCGEETAELPGLSPALAPGEAGMCRTGTTVLYLPSPTSHRNSTVQRPGAGPRIPFGRGASSCHTGPTPVIHLHLLPCGRPQRHVRS